VLKRAFQNLFIQEKPKLFGDSMVFGFLKKGDMKLELNKFSFSPGEEIKGKVTMKLKKPVQARGVNVVLVAEQKTTQVGFSSGGASSKTKIEKVINVSIPLDGEKEYGTQPYEYEFSLRVPDVKNAQAPEGALGSAVKAAAYLTQGAHSLNWYVEAKLDVPKGLDVGKKQAITVV
jgi:hypothetical protein